MAHSLFEPASPNFSEKLWQRVKDINFAIQGRRNDASAITATAEDRKLLQQMERTDARGRQALLAAALADNPICAQDRKLR